MKRTEMTRIWKISAVLTDEVINHWPAGFGDDLSAYLLTQARETLSPTCSRVLRIHVLPSDHPGLILIEAFGDTV